jgi:hypothetical protein
MRSTMFDLINIEVKNLSKISCHALIISILLSLTLSLSLEAQ